MPSPKGSASARQGSARNECGGEDKQVKKKSAGASRNFFIPDKKAGWEGKPSKPPREKEDPRKAHFLPCGSRCKKETHSHHLEALKVTAPTL